jgi:hypothetical protein
MTVRYETARERVPREAYFGIRARLARKAGRVGSFIFASRARLACLAHNSRTTSDEERSRVSSIAAEAPMNNRRWLAQGDCLAYLGRCLVCLSFRSAY